MYEKKVEPIYTEPKNAGNAFRDRYLQSVHDLVKKKQAESQAKRDAFGMKIAENRELYRQKYRDMLGWPLNEEPEPVRAVTEIPVYEDENCLIQRVQLEVFEDFQFYGIRMIHKTEEKLPYVIVQHGGAGTSEIVTSFFDSANYNDMALRVFNKGVNVFMPQLLLWAMPDFGEDFLKSEEDWGRDCRHRYDAALHQLGGSITALEIYCISRVLDYLEQKPEFNGAFGMAGLSYGGFYTHYTAAAEPRIRAALSCGQFNDRIKYNWSDWTWFNAANTFLDAEVCALICPNYLRIETGREDPLFDWKTAEAEYERLRRYYREAEENLHFKVFDGNHEFCVDEDSVAEFVDAVKTLVNG